jgi:hypothetical protein
MPTAELMKASGIGRMVEDEEERRAARPMSGNALWKVFNLTSFSIAFHQGRSHFGIYLQCTSEGDGFDILCFVGEVYGFFGIIFSLHMENSNETNKNCLSWIEGRKVVLLPALYLPKHCYFLVCMYWSWAELFN